MILLIAAMKPEADPLIRFYRLKKDMSVTAFPVFRNDSVALVISGTGKLRSAAAAAMLLTIYEARKDDTLLVNIGFAGSRFPNAAPGQLFVVHKITDADTGRDYYPDVLPEIGLPRAELTTYPRPVFEPPEESSAEASSPEVSSQEASSAEASAAESSSPIAPEDRFVLCDMEAAGIMEASARFLETQQVLILKVVSDLLSPDGLTADVLRGCMDDRVSDLAGIIQTVYEENLRYRKVLFADETAKLLEICRMHRFSRDMTRQLERILMKVCLSGGDAMPVLDEARTFTVFTKTEGKRVFEHIGNQLEKRIV